MIAAVTILHPTDFSPSAQKAFELAETLAASRNAHLVALHVRPRKGCVVCCGKTRAQTSREEDADLSLEELRSQCPAHFLAVIEHRLAQGEVVAEILRAAYETRAELIVMGSRGRTGLDRLALGSVADRVLCQARCPVVTVSIPTAVRSTFVRHTVGSPTESASDGASYGARFRTSARSGATGNNVVEPVGKANP